MKDLHKKSKFKSSNIFMTAIQILIIFLAKSLSDSVINYILYFNNLFSNILLATALKKLDIEIMSTAKVSTKELSSSFIELKHAKEILN